MAIFAAGYLKYLEEQSGAAEIGQVEIYRYVAVTWPLHDRPFHDRPVHDRYLIGHYMTVI